MRVDEAGHHRHALGVEDRRAAGRQVADVACRSDGDEAAVLDGERFGARRRGVAGEDARIEEDEIGLAAGGGVLREHRLLDAHATGPSSERECASESRTEPEKFAASTFAHGARILRQLGVFRLGLRQDRDVGVGVFPQGEEILVGSLRLGWISGQRERSAQLQVRQCAYGIRADDPR